MIELRKLAEKDAEFMLEWMHNYKIARAFKKDEMVSNYIYRAAV